MGFIFGLLVGIGALLAYEQYWPAIKAKYFKR